MKITRIETIPVRVPIRPEFQIQGALGSHTESPFVVLRVHTDEGITGLGEVSCTAIWSGEDATTAVHLIAAYLEPVLVGEDPRDVERLTFQMRRALAGNPFTKSGIEIALWDILGKSVGLPVYRLLGGAVRERIPIKMSVSGTTPERAAELARRIPPFVDVVGLFVNADPATVLATCARVSLNLLQFHGDEVAAECRRYRRPYIKAARVRQGLDLVEYAALFPDARGLLLDAFVEGYGGGGKGFDWSLIPPAMPIPLILAGGLDEHNVGQAIERVRPWAVDVSSGV
ncbi:MAG: hypothetical protein JNL62_26815, partial [Bryobacterales bacterium]|nr:hypothetical protein [Bryobacterales bacterium]